MDLNQNKNIKLIYCLFLITLFSCKGSNSKEFVIDLDSCVSVLNNSMIRCEIKFDTVCKFPYSIIDKEKIKTGKFTKRISVDGNSLYIFKNIIEKCHIEKILLYDNTCILFELKNSSNIFSNNTSFIAYVENYSKLKTLDFTPLNINKLKKNWYTFERKVSY
ncbi:MAG: hypothetical protein WCK02_07190 [Bacteroidota bacterium]